MTLPAVSIIMPVYNGKEFLDEAFQSIFDQTFLQKGGRLEISVFDDGSSDNTAQILDSWKAKMSAAFPETLTFTYGVNVARLEAAKRGEQRAEAYAVVDTVGEEPIENDEDTSEIAACGLCKDVFPPTELAGKKKNTKAGEPLFCLSCRSLSKDAWAAKRKEAYDKRILKAQKDLPATSSSPSGVPCGIGFACNSAVKQSSGEFLCRFDADDIMHKDRVELQLDCMRSLPEADRDRTLLGSGFVRLPEDATPRYTRWLNEMTDTQLMAQRFREVTLLHPTWCYHRRIWERVGGYVEDTRIGEDIVFFHRHLETGGRLQRVPRPLLSYRCHPGQRSWRLPRQAVQEAKVSAFERQVLDVAAVGSPWQDGFAVVGAGRDARTFCRSMSVAGRAKITAFHDVDPKKINTTINLPGGLGEPDRQVPILPQAALVSGPFVVCVALERGYGVESAIVDGRPDAVEGVDYFHMV